MVILENGQINSDQWDQFVVSENSATPYQLWGWKEVYQQTLGIKTQYLALSDNGHITGILPLLSIKSPIMGNYLTSMPGGILAKNVEGKLTLLEYAIKLAKEFGVDYLALRDSPERLDSIELVTCQEQCTFLLDLTAGKSATKENIPWKTFKCVEKAKDNAVIGKIDNDLINDYYPIYLEAMRERGTPTQGAAFFEKALSIFSDRLHLIVITQQEKILGGGFVIDFPNTLYCAWSGLLAEYYSLNTSHVLFWEAIKCAISHEKKYIDLGRCTCNSGSYRYKLHWAAKPKPLYQQYYLIKRSLPPKSADNRIENVYYQKCINLWHHIPLSITELIGPKLRKQVPLG